MIGTILYLLFFEFIREYSLRAFALAIPVMLTTIGFNYYQVDMSVLNTKKRLILVINIIVLVFLAVIGYYLYIRLDYDQREHESATSTAGIVIPLLLQKEGYLILCVDRWSRL